VACIAEGLSGQGGINLDYDEVSELLSHTGLGVVSTGLASGVDRASEASEQAIMQSGAAELSSARRVYVTITASMLQMQELDTVLRRVQSATEDSIFTISSPVFDEAMGDELRVTILATGINT
jgi:cell division protein FtsZ